MAARFPVLVAIATLALGNAVSLPSVHARDPAGIPGGAKWWARVGERVFYAPPASASALSQEASSYYYAIGSSEALTDEMKKHRVGGDARWHIFHLPGGASSLQVPTRGDRHRSFSSLVQLEHAQVLQNTFPEYKTNESYAYPGSDAALQKEQEAVKAITDALYKDYLTKVTTLGADKEATRSSDNAAATQSAVDFLQAEFKALGLASCIQHYDMSYGERSNVVVYIPGSSRRTLTLGAHYDSRPYEGAAPGANDNGSGVAALLAIAKAFTSAKMKPVRDLYLVGFGSEEEGLVGSAAFVAGLLSKGNATIPEACRPAAAKPSFLQTRSQAEDEPQHAAIILDEIGWKSASIKPTANLEAKDNAYSLDLLNQLAQASKLYNQGELQATHSSNPFGSDHMSWIDEGLPAALIINGEDEAYPAYHSSNDTMDMVDISYAARISRMVFGGLVRTAGLQAS